jgi:outer membrane biogenesis lipoprotein LolB
VKNAFFAAVAMLLLAGCSGKTEEVNACVERGVAYFKEIGSYPTLSSAPNKGRAAEDVARERCNRTTTAF